MGSIVKGVASLFGGRKRRKEQRAANRSLDTAQAAQDNYFLPKNDNATSKGPPEVDPIQALDDHMDQHANYYEQPELHNGLNW